MRVALVQLECGDNAAVNLPVTEALIREAATGGATFILTPECTNQMSLSWQHQNETLQVEEEDNTLARMRQLADELGVTLLLGSLCLKESAESSRFVNRSLLIGPDGQIRDRYDKIHMFDVDLPSGESYRESSTYKPGSQAVLTRVDDVPVGLHICYDVRFSKLSRSLAQAGAEILTFPAAFTVPTGRAHWHALLRTRAIESGCFVLAPAQTGQHVSGPGKERRTYGHSLAIGPWGDILADAGSAPNTVTYADLDLSLVAKARAQVPSLLHDREFSGPAGQ